MCQFSSLINLLSLRHLNKLKVLILLSCPSGTTCVLLTSTIHGDSNRLYPVCIFLCSVLFSLASCQLESHSKILVWAAFNYAVVNIKLCLEAKLIALRNDKKYKQNKNLYKENAHFINNHITIHIYKSMVWRCNMIWGTLEGIYCSCLTKWNTMIRVPWKSGLNAFISLKMISWKIYNDERNRCRPTYPHLPTSIHIYSESDYMHSMRSILSTVQYCKIYTLSRHTRILTFFYHRYVDDCWGSGYLARREPLRITSKWNTQNLLKHGDYRIATYTWSLKIRHGIPH